MARNKKNRPAALAVALMTVGIAVAFIFACDRIPWLSEKVNSGIEAIVGKRVIYTELPADILEVQVIDVGQGDSILIRCPDGNILIDAGTAGSEYKLEAHLDSLDIDKLDYFICTHPHDDHIGGADMILREFSVTNLLVNGAATDSVANGALLLAADKSDVVPYVPSLGEVFTLGEVSFTIMGPAAEADDQNDMSIVVMLQYGDTSFLFTGDAEEVSELSMLELYGEDALDCDFYKVGHHGSSSSSTEEFLSAITPEVAVISCGDGNEYGHPHRDVLQRLSDMGCNTILRTDEDGTVVVRSDGKELTVYSPMK